MSCIQCSALSQIVSGLVSGALQISACSQTLVSLGCPMSFSDILRIGFLALCRTLGFKMHFPCATHVFANAPFI